MKYIITSILCLVTFTLMAQDLENTMLWKIEGNEIKESYLFGTIHATCEAELDEKVIKALDNTNLLVLELDMDDPNLQAAMMKVSLLPEGESIKKYLSDEDVISVNEFLTKQTGMSLDMVNKFKPMILQSMLIPKMLDCEMQSYEVALMANAKEHNEEVLGLESLEDQMDVFNNIPLQLQVEELVQKAKNGLEEDKELFAKLMQAYESENHTELNELMNESDEEWMQEYSHLLLDERNIKWISQIKEISGKNKAFYGVGAAHLSGEKGVVNLLREAGYEVTPVMD